MPAKPMQRDRAGASRPCSRPGTSRRMDRRPAPGTVPVRPRSDRRGCLRAARFVGTGPWSCGFVAGSQRRSRRPGCVQATFPRIECRKAESIRNRLSVANWLYGVAHRVASRARSTWPGGGHHERRAATLISDSVRRDRRSRGRARSGRGDPAAPGKKYRIVVVLCCFEGQSQEQAAATRWSRLGQFGVDRPGSRAVADPPCRDAGLRCRGGWGRGFRLGGRGDPG